MTQFTKSIAVRMLTRQNTIVVTVQGDSFGSLEAAKLVELRTELDALTAELRPYSGHRIIVDLAEITMMGSGFLSELFLWIGSLKRSRGDVILCGDRMGLLKLCAADRWLTIRSGLFEAIEYSSSGQRTDTYKAG